MSSKFSRNFLIAVSALIIVPFMALAADATAGLSSATSEEYGEYLTTSDGFAVYQFVRDSEDESACVGSCTNNWYPVLAGVDGDVAVEGDVDADLVGTVVREDGSVQITYGGHPLYTSRHDDVGETNGQNIGRESFNLVSLAGEPITEAAEAAAVELDEEVLAGLMADGENVYRMHCAACHGDQGQGGVGPSLAANAFLNDTNSLIDQVLVGFPEHGMPPFAGVLDDHEISSLLTFIRSSFNNDYGPVLEEEVAQRR